MSVASSSPPGCVRRMLSWLHGTMTAIVLCTRTHANSYKKSPVSPFLTAGVLSRVYFIWASDLIHKAAYGDPVSMEELWELRPQESCGPAHTELQSVWEREKAAAGGQGRPPSFTSAVWRTVRWTIARAFLFKMGWLVFAMLSNSLLLREVVAYFTNGRPVWYGAVLTILFFIVEALRSVCVNQHWLIVVLGGIRLRGAVRSMIFEKALRLAPGAVTVGKGVTLITSDTVRIHEAMNFGEFLLSTPVAILVTLGVMYSQVGPAALAGFAAMLIFVPIQALLGNRVGALRQRLAKVTDERAKTMNEVLTGVKLIKFNAWEAAFADLVASIRRRELGFVKSSALLRGINTVVSFSVPVIVTLATFATYTLWTGSALSPSSAFVVIGLFNVARFCLNISPLAVRNVSEAIVACARIQEFLSLPEVRPEDCPLDATSNDPVAFERAAAAIGVRVPLPAPDVALQAIAASYIWPKVEQAAPAAAVTSGCCRRAGRTVPPQHTQSQNPLTISRSGGACAPPTTVDPNSSGRLDDVNFEVTRGECVGVVGPVGAGKSSLLQSVLGQMRRERGSMTLRGSTAYVSQAPWIFAGTVRENIVFGQDFDQQWYDKVIAACALTADLQQLPAGDSTEIGERGINLSGGQKARVALARAVYVKADVYLLDDPLSAVDVHVGRHLWQHCIQDTLVASGKTVLIATHQLQYLGDCSKILELNAGRIVRAGSPSEFATVGARGDAARAGSSDTEDAASDAINGEPPAAIPTTAPAASAVDARSAQTGEPPKGRALVPKATGSQLVVAEERQMGAALITSLVQYFSAAGSGLFIVFLLLLLLLAKGARLVSDWYLSYWTQRGSSTTSVHEERVLLGYYAVTVAGIMLFTGFQALGFMGVTLRAARIFHDRVFASVMRATSSWFDTQPTGRILARFTGDIDTVDSSLPTNMEMASENAVYIAMSLVLIAIIFPWFLIPMVPIAAVFAFAAGFFRRASRDLKRLDNISRSPLVSHIQATLQGLASIRAFAAQERYISLNSTLNDNTSRTYWAFYGANRWIAIRLDWVTTCIVTITVAFCVASRDVLAPGLAALTIVQALQTAGLLQYTVRLLTDTEAQFTSVERLNYYSNSVPHEDVTVGPAYTEQQTKDQLRLESGPDDVPRKRVTSEGGAGTQSRGHVTACGFPAWYPATWNAALLKAQWPTRGEIVLEKVAVRYREGLPLVLQDVSLRIQGQHKVGIVGRTGSGKSTLSLALFRMLECAAGRITIDGLDISKVNLYQLRSRLAIIPQDPTLYTGTVRSNLDVFGEYSDEQLWDVMRQAGMEDFVMRHPKQLLQPIAEAGGNMSVGERQLLCLARALLRDARIIVMDEATANIDSVTDAKIQRAIRVGMRHATVAVVAHRLHTIMDCDRVLVLSDGRAIEYDTPAALLGLAQPSEERAITGAFRAMVDQTGARTAAMLQDLAVAAQAARKGTLAAAIPATHEPSSSKSGNEHGPLSTAATPEVVRVVVVDPAAPAETE